MSINNLKKEIFSSDSEIIEYDTDRTYKFKRYAFGERGSFIKYELIDEIANGLMSSFDTFSDFDYLVSPEPGGHTWGMLMAYILKKNLRILRLSDDKDEAELCERETAYTKNKLVMQGFNKGDRIVLIDDVISSGGTMKSIVGYLQKMEVNVIGIVVIACKGNCYKELGRTYDVPIHMLIVDEEI